MCLKNKFKVLIVFGLWCFLGACAARLIPGTLVVDTPMNRSVVNVVMAYKNALEAKDQQAILSLCSMRYFEDKGNADPNDDYGYSTLKDVELPKFFANIKEVQLELEIKEVTVKQDRATADFRFFYKMNMALASGEKWGADAEINRIELALEEGVWKIISGL